MNLGWNEPGVKWMWGEMTWGEMIWGEMNVGWNDTKPQRLSIRVIGKSVAFHQIIGCQMHLSQSNSGIQQFSIGLNFLINSDNKKPPLFWAFENVKIFTLTPCHVRCLGWLSHSFYPSLHNTLCHCNRSNWIYCLRADWGRKPHANSSQSSIVIEIMNGHV